MGRKKSKEGTDGKTKPVSITMSEKLKSAIDMEIDGTIDGLTSRSEIIENICSKYFPLRHCKECHKLIPTDSNYCPYCGSKIIVSYKDRKLAKHFFLEDNPKYKDTDDYIYKIYLTDQEVELILSGECLTKLKAKPMKISKKDMEEIEKRREMRRAMWRAEKEKDEVERQNEVIMRREEKKRQKELMAEKKEKSTPT